MREAILALFLVLCVAGVAPAFESPQTVDEIRDCAEKNLPEHTLRQRVEIESEDRVGGRRNLEARVHWKRFEKGPRVMIRVDGPAEVRGAAYLAIEAEEGDDETIFMYLPAIGMVRRVTANHVAESLWDTDFSYEDMKYLQGVQRRDEGERLADDEVEGRPVFVLQTRSAPDDPEAIYERVVTFVDQQTCVALRTDFYERGDTIRKTLLASIGTLEADGERWRVGEYAMNDLKNETRTWLRVKVGETDVKLPDRLFSSSGLGRVR